MDISVNIIDDDLPEEMEHFTIKLKNPKGGAEIGFNGQVSVNIVSNDDAHGIIGFTQVIKHATCTFCQFTRTYLGHTMSVSCH